MQTRLPTLLVVMLALVATAMGSVIALGTTQGTAEACSPPGRGLTVTPAGVLAPGDSFIVEGHGFYDFVPFEEGEPDLFSCGFKSVVAKGDMEVQWQGDNVEAVLGIVSGSDFIFEATVPADAAQGIAGLSVDGWTVGIDVDVAQPPCLIPVDLDLANGCPPEPCVLNAVDGGEVCVPPCEVVGGDAVWCPPPPCPTHITAPCELPPCSIETIEAYGYCPEPCLIFGAEPDWCPEKCDPDDPDSPVACIEPCQVVLADLHGCPPPCEVVGGDAVWCPPEPCLVYIADDVEACPPPCVLNAADGGGDDVWCPPPPCLFDAVTDATTVPGAPLPAIDCPIGCYLDGFNPCVEPCPLPEWELDADVCRPKPCGYAWVIISPESDHCTPIDCDYGTAIVDEMCVPFAYLFVDEGPVVVVASSGGGPVPVPDQTENGSVTDTSDTATTTTNTTTNGTTNTTTTTDTGNRFTYDPVLPWERESSSGDVVAGVSVTQAAAAGPSATGATRTSGGLAHTGSDSTHLAFMGAGLVVAGAVALAGRRKVLVDQL